MHILAYLLVGSFLGQSQPGTTVMPILRLEQGIRSAAMGGAGIGLADDAASLYWNAAGLGRLSDHNYAFTHQRWFGGIKDELLHVAVPAGPGSYAMSAVYSGEPGNEAWNERNEPQGTFRAWDGVVSAGYGWTLVRGVQIGLAFKGFYQDLYTSSGYGGAADVGFVCRPMSFLTVGAVGRNIGIAYYGSNLEQMPMEIGLGAGAVFGPTRFALDLVAPIEGGLSVRAGAEYRPASALALRLGYRAGPQDIASLGLASGLTAGLGVSYSGLGLDYAVTPYGKMGMAHRLGIQMRLARSGQGSLKVTIVESGGMLPLDADITFGGIRSQSVRTGRSGRLELDQLPAGPLVIRTQSVGYAPRVDTMDIVGDRQQTAIITLTSLEYGGLSGATYDAETRRPMAASLFYRGRLQGGLTTDAELGSYTAKGIPVGEYVVTVSGSSEGYLAQTCTLRIESGRMTVRDFYLVKQRQAAGLQDIGFEAGRADIPAELDPLLARAAEVLKTNPSVTLELAGHTDPEESLAAEYASNWELSQARAEAVKKALVDKYGIDPARLTAHGYADTQPVASSATEEGKAKNRRTELRVSER
jgi:outer membrane protein OmpA-like peptidoglycan-associated protein